MNDKARTAGASWLWPCALVAVAAIGVRTVAHGSIWMHLAAGRWISEHGIPRTDPFSFTRAGAPWVDLAWLYDALVFHVHKGGMPLLILVHVAAMVAAFGLLGWVARRYAGPAAISLTALLCGWIMAPEFRASPELLSLLLPALLVATLSRGAPGVPGLVGLCAVQALWANLSPTFLVGPLLGAAFAAGEAFRRRSDDDEEHEGGLRGYLAATTVLLAASMATPYGPAALLHAGRALFGGDAVYSLERVSPFAHLMNHALPGRLNALALAIGAGGLLTYRKNLPMGLTLAAVLGAVFSLSARNPVLFPRTHLLFPVLAFPFLALSLTSIGEALKARLAPSGEAPLLRKAAALAVVLGTFATLWAIVSNQYYRAAGSASSFGLGVEEQMFPAGAASALDRDDLPAPLAHLPHDAGYLAWRHPTLKLCLDHRPGVYSKSLHQEILRALSGQPQAWSEFEEQVRPQTVLLNLTAPESSLLAQRLQASGAWTPLYVDGTSALLIRKEHEASLPAEDMRREGLATLEARRQALRAALRNPVRLPFSGSVLGAAYYFSMVGRLPQTEAASELVTCMLPCMRSAWSMLGSCRLQSGNIEAAVAALQKAVRGEDRDARPWLLLSEALKNNGDTAGSEQAIEKARSINPEAVEAFLQP